MLKVMVIRMAMVSDGTYDEGDDSRHDVVGEESFEIGVLFENIYSS